MASNFANVEVLESPSESVLENSITKTPAFPLMAVIRNKLSVYGHGRRVAQRTLGGSITPTSELPRRK